MFNSSEYTEEEFKNRITEQINNVLERYHNGDYKKLIEEGYYTEEEVNEIPTNPMKYIGGFCIWNTPTFFDLWLIRNCPLEFIQKRLHEQYGDIENIKNYQSLYDKFKRNGLGKNIKIKKLKFDGGLPYKDVQQRHRGKKCKWTRIDVNMPKQSFGDNNEFSADYGHWYHDDIDKWCYYIETNILDTYSSSSYYNVCGFMSNKAVYRKLQKWDLPEGSKVTITYEWSIGNRYVSYIEKEIIIKKKK